MAELETYQIEYNEFIAGYKKGAADPESVGFLIVRMAQYFSEANIKVAEAEVAFNKVASTIADQIDEGSGKTISVAKADKYADATPEGNLLDMNKAHLSNLEQIINALKSLQKGVLNEYAHQGLT